MDCILSMVSNRRMVTYVDFGASVRFSNCAKKSTFSGLSISFLFLVIGITSEICSKI